MKEFKKNVSIKYNMTKVFIKNVEKVSFQIGVDILGFPIYHEHIFMDAIKAKDKTKMKGKTELVINKYL